MRKLAFLALAVFTVIGFSVVLARPVVQAPPQADAQPRTEVSVDSLASDVLSIRLLLGVGDSEPESWSGDVKVDQGEIIGLQRWRLRGPDTIIQPAKWSAKSVIASKGDPKATPKAKRQAKAAPVDKSGHPLPPGYAVAPAGIVVLVKAPLTARLTVATEQGEAQISLADIASGAPKRYLDSRLEAQIIPSSASLSASDGEEDFPSIACDDRSGAWVLYVEHMPVGPATSATLSAEPADFKAYVPKGGGDQLKLLHYNGTTVDSRLDVTEAGCDLWRPAVALAGEEVIAVWPEQKDGNWDLYARTYAVANQSWTEPRRLTTDTGSDSDPVLVSVSGKVHVIWQAWRDGQSDIYCAPLDAPDMPQNLSDHPANDWYPAAAVSQQGELLVAFDSYRNGNYDVYLARVTNSGKQLLPITTGPSFEAKPALAVDSKGCPWIAYEERTPDWGKDSGKFSGKEGTALYRASTVRVCCVDGAKVLNAGNPLAQLSPNLAAMNSYPRLAMDRSDHPWLLFRHRQENNWRGAPVPVVGAVWMDYATTLSGNTWQSPMPMAHTDNLLDNRPALGLTSDGTVIAVHSSDGRLHSEGVGPAATGRRAAQGDPQARSWVNNDLYISALRLPTELSDIQLGQQMPPAQDAPSTHPTEPEDIKRMRAYRVDIAGRNLQLLRGEFHRHTEISSDGGGDGALEDMWRYGLDAAGLDWIGCGDHDNGNGREYPWWITQKTTDLYHNPPFFLPMFTYERSVNYPGGHRNVMFSYRGVRTLPRLSVDRGVQTDVNGRDPDARMLFKYLNELNGICAAHTSGTDMGTDWRENDPRAEPFVEIYQGARDSYEYFGAPRVAHGPSDAAGGWRPLGMVWNALAMQYRIGFQSSSDHVSTHISYAMAFVEKPTREALFDAFQKRHCYAATDNILLEVRSGDKLMGDEFDASGPVTLSVLAHGTAPIKRIDVIKDFHYVYSTEPGAARAEFSWTDESTDESEATLPVSWYYVRVLQEDGEIAWASPMWIRRAVKAVP